MVSSKSTGQTSTVALTREQKAARALLAHMRQCNSVSQEDVLRICVEQQCAPQSDAFIRALMSIPCPKAVRHMHTQVVLFACGTPDKLPTRPAAQM